MYKKICVAILIISIIICINILRLYDKIDTFNNRKDNYNNDGNMTFPYLSDKNTNYILATYYLDHDRKINGQKLNFHPYEKKVPNFAGDSAAAFPYIYGNPATHLQRSPKIWKKYDTEYQDLYNAYRIRR